MLLCRSGYAAIFLAHTFPVAASAETGSEHPNARGTKGRLEALFDGKTTNGWRNYRSKTISDGWKVVDGALTRVGPSGDIVTIDQYQNSNYAGIQDFHGGNSGFMFHVIEESLSLANRAQVQILDNKGEDPQKAGWLYDLYKADTDATKPAGQWNQCDRNYSAKK